ncbi:MAG: hypothetical protein JW759_08815 [Candidatus Coatesbacteria bacterium]|nr:hypothetical protein [Candidatus Coatesbacteria bacterium]
MGDEKKPCPDCGNKLNYSRADEIYLCPYCGMEFVERAGKLVRKGAEASSRKGDMTAEEMKAELEGAFKDSLIATQLADDRAKVERRKDEALLLDLRLSATEARRTLKLTSWRGIGLCIFLDFVILALSYNYDVLAYGLAAMALLTLGTYFYLSSQATKVRKQLTSVAAETKVLEKELYLKELEKELDEDEGPEE